MARIARSLLFVPGDRPQRFEKAAACGAHEMVIDLEDAVAPDNKPSARAAAMSWLASGGATTVRINGMDSPWFEDDIAMLRGFSQARVMLPKTEPEALQRVSSELDQRPLVALIETVRGVMTLRELTGVAGLERLAFGSVDFSVESGITDAGESLASVRSQIVLESCYAGLLAPVDGVSVEFNDVDVMREQAVHARQRGFGGKLCIHPRQVGPVNEAFTPSADEVAWAERVIAAIADSGGGATTVDGKMVDKPVVEQARRILAGLG